MIGFRLAQAMVLAAGGWLIYGGWPVLGTLLMLMSVGYIITDRIANRVVPPPDDDVGEEVRAFHKGCFVADFHADVALWRRDHMRRHRRGHVDLPRLGEGGVALQFVTVPTKLVITPRMQRLFLSDLFFWGSLLSLERPYTWFSTAARARLQVRRLQRWVERSGGRLRMLRTREDLVELQRRRGAGEDVVGVMLGLEGAHALRAGIDVPWLAEHGFRVLGITHFNDTRFGGSAHSLKKGGLTEAGRELVRELEAHHISIDLAHASPAVIDDVLSMCELRELRRPLLVSHTGAKGIFDHKRNISDAHATAIARGGGLIGVSFFVPALPRAEIAAVAETVVYLVQLFDKAGLDGARHVALGSDFDGAVRTVIDAAGWPRITGALLDAGLTEEQVRLVLGENLRRFFEENL